MAGPSLTSRRAIYFRNQSLDRKETEPLSFIRKLDVYSTSPTSHLGLVARIKGYRVEHLATLVEDRAIVAMGAMRGSGYFVPVEMIPMIVASTTRRRSTVEKQLIGGVLKRSAYDRLSARVEKVLAGREMSTTEIKRGVKPKQGDEAHVFSWVIRLMGGECRLVRTATTGSWKSNKGLFRLWDEWLPDVDPFSMAPDEAQDALAQHYFDAHGPATIADFAWWSGFKQAAEIVARAGVPDAGEGYFGTAVRKVSSPKGVRLVPYWDAAFLTLRDRTHLISDADYGRVYDDSGNPAPVVLVDGGAKGVWSMLQDKKRLIVRAAPFKSFSAAVWKKIEAEAELIATATGAPDVQVERSKNPPPIAGGPRNLFMNPLRS